MTDFWFDSERIGGRWICRIYYHVPGLMLAGGQGDSLDAAFEDAKALGLRKLRTWRHDVTKAGLMFPLASHRYEAMMSGLEALAREPDERQRGGVVFP